MDKEFVDVKVPGVLKHKEHPLHTDSKTTKAETLVHIIWETLGVSSPSSIFVSFISAILLCLFKRKSKQKQH